MKNLIDYVNALLSKRRLIIYGATATMLLATLVTLFMPNVYEAKAIVYIFPPVTGTELIPASVSVEIDQAGPQRQDTSMFRGNIGSRIRGYMVTGISSLVGNRELARSPSTLKELRDRLGIYNMKIEHLRKILNIELVEIYKSLYERKYEPMFILTAKANNAKLAQGLVNAWAKILIDKVNEINTYRYKEISEFISSQLETSQKNLLEKERLLNDFMKTNSIATLEMELKTKQDNFLVYNSELNKVRIFMKEEGALMQKVNLLKTQEEYFLGLLDKTAKEIARLQADIYDKKQQLAQLQREVDIGRMNYELFEQKKAQFVISNVERPGIARIISEAVEPQMPIQPNRIAIILTAGLFALIIMIILISISQLMFLK
jgi:uncharacterized protein involved in exopolysaccharide biosynthesis